jgi:DNA primase
MRVSKELLFQLRNNIPIDDLIKFVFYLENRYREGHLRFLCPVCGDLHTSVNKKTNLARCFICQKNFNPIDLTMKCRNLDFKQSVNFLERMLPFYDKKRQQQV